MNGPTTNPERPSRFSRAMSSVPVNHRPKKPRSRGVTEIRGPYYRPLGPRGLRDLLEAFGEWIDIFKFGGGSFALMNEATVREMIDLAHAHGVVVSTGGFLERVLVGDAPDGVSEYLREVVELGFDVVEVSSGFISMSHEDLIALVKTCLSAGLRVKPEINVQFGAGGGSTSIEELEAEGNLSVDRATRLGEAYLRAGAEMLMVESEGLTENVRSWRTDPIFTIAERLGLESLMFEAAEPRVFGWYVKNFGPAVNLFVDHTQIVQLEALRSGLWAEASLFGRVVTYRPGDPS